MPARRRISPITLLIVVLGGALGVTLRALVTLPPGPDAHPLVVPSLTLGCNVVGSFVLGVLVARLGDDRPQWRAFLGTGVLGGFTTYSAFAVQSVQVATVAPIVGLLFVVLSLALGGLAAAVGVALGASGARQPESAA